MRCGRSRARGPRCSTSAASTTRGSRIRRPAPPRAPRSGCRRTARSSSSPAAAGGWATSAGRPRRRSPGRGGTGAGRGAAAEALAVPRATVLALCGSREGVRTALEARFAGSDRLRVLGFTDRMPDLLAAADVLVHSTAGLTVLEALVTGCSVVSYGWGRGHIRANNLAFTRHGMARVAATRDDLRGALRAALADRRARDPAFAALPTAAQVLLARYAPRAAAA